MPGHNELEIAVDRIGAHVVETKDYHAWKVQTTCSHKLPKIEVMGKKNAPFPPSLLQNMRIGFLSKTVVRQMDRIMAQTGEECHRLRGDAHIGEEFHADAGSVGYTASSANQATYCSA